MKQLLNMAETFGTFNGTPIDDWTELTVELTALKITKSADKPIWVDGELTYTITVENIDTALPVVDVSVTDKIVPTIARLVNDSVYLDDRQLTTPDDYTYDADGKLTILADAIGNIPVGGKIEITFRVDFAQP